jgi:hypothetical protein
MNKLIILNIPLCLSILLAKAQTKDSPNYDKTGGWIHYAPKDSYLHLHNPMGPGDAGYPTLQYTDVTKYVMTKTLNDKLKTLLSVFKDAYPNPQGACITYSLQKVAKEKPNDAPRLIKLYLNAYQLENDGKGGLNKLDVANDIPGKFTGEPPNYDGLLSVFINKIPHDEQYGFFQKQKQFDEILKTKQIPNVSGIYMMPPQNNFEEAASYNTAAVYKNMAVPKADNADSDLDKYTVFRFVSYFNDNKYGLVERHMDKIILTGYNKLPYKPLTRGEFIEVLLLKHKTEFNKFKNDNEKEEVQKQMNEKAKNLYLKNLQRYENEITALEKIKELNKNDLSKPATLSIANKNIVNDLYSYAYNSKNYAELQIQKLKEVFIDDVKMGYTPCKFIKYYQSAKDEDIQSIMVNWSYELPVGNNPKANEHPNLDSRSMYQAIKNNLDWSKLEALLMKIK